MGDRFVVGVVAVGVVLVGVIEVLVLVGVVAGDVVLVAGEVVLVGVGGVLDDLTGGGSKGTFLPPSLLTLAGLDEGVWSDRESRDLP